MRLIDIDKANISDIEQTSLEPVLSGVWCEVNDIKDWLYKQPVTSQWIRVEDSLPARNGRYLTYNIIAGRGMITILGYEKYKGFDDEVMYWMPLPIVPM